MRERKVQGRENVKEGGRERRAERDGRKEMGKGRKNRKGEKRGEGCRVSSGKERKEERRENGKIVGREGKVTVLFLVHDRLLGWRKEREER